MPEPLTPPVGIRPRLSTGVWAMAMGKNEEVSCGVWFVVWWWFVVCGVVWWSPPSYTIELGEPSYTVELSHVLPTGSS